MAVIAPTSPSSATIIPAMGAKAVFRFVACGIKFMLLTIRWKFIEYPTFRVPLYCLDAKTPALFVALLTNSLNPAFPPDVTTSSYSPVGLTIFNFIAFLFLVLLFRLSPPCDTSLVAG